MKLTYYSKRVNLIQLSNGSESSKEKNHKQDLERILNKTAEKSAIKGKKTLKPDLR